MISNKQALSSIQHRAGAERRIVSYMYAMSVEEPSIKPDDTGSANLDTKKLV